MGWQMFGDNILSLTEVFMGREAKKHEFVITSTSLGRLSERLD